MKTGMNVLLWTAGVEAKDHALLASIREWGFDGVEVPMFDTEGSDWAAIGKKCDELGLGRTVVAVLPGGANLIGDDAGERAAAVDFLKRCVDRCVTLGAETLAGPICSPVGRLVGRGPTGDERKRAVEGLKALGAHAEKAGIMVAVEALNRFETYFINSMEQTSDLIDEVGSPAIKQMYDTFHANIEEKDIAAAVRRGGDRIIHVHISANDRATPGEDHIDYKTTFKALKEIGYDGWLTIEAFGSALPELAGATCIWRKMAPSQEHVARQGLKLIRELWG